MASREHIQQLTNHSSSPSSTSEEELTSSEELTPVVIPKKKAPPSRSSGTTEASPDKKKKRLTISLHLGSAKKEDESPSPPKNNVKKKKKKKPDPEKSIKPKAEPNDDVKKKNGKKKRPSKPAADAAVEEPEIKATVVESSGEDDAVAAVVEEPKAASKAAASAPLKRKASTGVRPVRMPPISSPGLLMPSSSGSLKVDSKGYTTPANVFEHAMSLAGYTTEKRSENPHRGSSVQRVVGDMFDTNVALALHFPPLVPPGLFPTESVDTGTAEELPAQRLVRALESSTTPSRKRRRQWDMKDMVPVSLTLPYPERYLQKRLEYIAKVREREGAIVARQQAEEEALTAQEEYEFQMAGQKQSAAPAPKPPKTVPIPPIPQPPSPPRIEELEGLDKDQFEGTHPYYIPKGSEKLVAHLDRNCFDSGDGRYFGLMTNSVADPHFVGPSAPGIGGLNASGGTGLATAHAGGAGSILSSTSFHHSASSVSGAGTTSNKASKAKKSSGSASGAAAGAKKPQVGPTPTATAAELRKSMEVGGELARKLKSCIIRAAVHASRTGRHGQSFYAPDGETYPDVSKAFAAHAGLKPCTRCKNNKQGAYHCRLRRKHKDLDYDGSDSPAVLTPLFEERLEDLLWEP